MIKYNIFWRSHNIILYCVALFCANSASMAADCTAQPGFQTITIYRALNDVSLNIPQDTPVGKTVYEETLGSAPDLTNYRCNGKTNMGIIVNSFYSSQPSSGTKFSIPGTGLSWFIRSSYPGEEVSSYYSNYADGTENRLLPASVYTFGLVKTGLIPTGTKYINGHLATLVRDNLDLIKFNLQLTINHEAASCKTPNVQVNMGADHNLNTISNTAPPPVTFTLDLLDCPRSIKAVSYTFKANTATIDSKMSVVALSADSTARGFGLQLLNENSQPIEFDKSQLVIGYPSYIGGNYHIPFKAAYYRIPGQSLKAGTTNSSITFIMSYL